MQSKPKVLPFGGLSDELALLIDSGRWLGAVLAFLGAVLLLATKGGIAQIFNLELEAIRSFRRG
jgi:hypothetical protein